MRKLVFYIWCLLCIIQVSAEAKTKVMLFGDSLMAGYGLTQNHHLDKILQKKFGDRNITFINASVSGDTTKGGLERIDWSLGDKPDLIFLCLGANDMLRGINPKVTRDNLDMMIRKIKNKNIKIILAGMVAQKSYGKSYAKEFNSIYPDLSKKHKIKLYPFLLDGVALKPELNLDDGKHPNIKGVEIIAKNIFPIIQNEIFNK
ncbi:MAG: arylesterase [alpha proteobacterium HIMB114]|nr:MAG: arylesterase [alpha proteobacterium HIMB114]